MGHAQKVHQGQCAVPRADTQRLPLLPLFCRPGLDLAHHGKVHIDEFIAAALDQKKIMTSKTINTIFGAWGLCGRQYVKEAPF